MRIALALGMVMSVMPLVGKQLSAELTQAKLINSSVTDYMKKKDIPGIAVGFYHKGKSYFYNFGYGDPQKKSVVTKHTIFEIGSITKSFTATILALEVLKGSMHLNDSLSEFIPFIRKHSLSLKDITLEQLATHTASLPRKSPVRKPLMTKPRVLHAMLRWEPEYALGTKYHYSNLGYNLLGYALEGHAHTSYMNLFKKYILHPLHMDCTYLKVPHRLKNVYAQGHSKTGIPVARMHNNALGAAGSLKSTCEDMMKFLKANLGLLGPASLIEAMTYTHNGFFKATRKMTQGLSWEKVFIDGDEIIDKNGGVTGFSTWIGFIPKKKIGLILLTNKRNRELTPFARDLLSRLAHISIPSTL